MTEKMKEEMLPTLTDLYKMEACDLCTFDVRDYEFRSVVNDALRPESNLTKSVRKRLDTDLRTYEETKNIVVKTAIGKKWAKAFNYDYDASLFANLLYQKTMLPSGSIKPLDSGEYEYMIFSGGIYYRGDTMNSWSTTLNEFIRRNGEQYVADWNGKYIPKGYKSWVEFLSNPENYTEPLPSYITEFMKVVYTIGNFIPVPSAFQERGRYTNSYDYWDLALLAIYDYYHGTNYSFPPFSLRWLVGDAENAKECRPWLESFNCWDDFVERNYFQPFVGPYGFPRELWKGHFTGDVMPQTESQFEEFFTNASAWILARGNRIAVAIKEKLKGKSDQELENLAKQMTGEPI